jgi:3-hydroxyacyl-CoA dehydrogenase
VGDDVARISTQDRTFVSDAAPSVAIVGAGSIGIAWSIVFARAGSAVRVYDVSPRRREGTHAAIDRRLAELLGAGLLDESADTVEGRIDIAPDLQSAVTGADWVQECATEDLEVKRSLFADLDRLTDANALLASSTSMIACSRWAAGLAGRERCLVVHPGNPPYLLPVAEIVPAPFTSSATVARAQSALARAGMVPVLVHGEPEGFVFNRLQGALLREAYCLVRDGVATAADIDRIVSSGLGRRWAVIGPFAVAQLNTRGGVRRHASVMGPAYERMGADRGEHDPWTADLVAKVAADVDARLPPEEWDEQVMRRDEAIIALERARQADRQLFAFFDDSSAPAPRQ